LLQTKRTLKKTGTEEELEDATPATSLLPQVSPNAITVADDG
jgi:hypothetical protein